MLDPCLRGTVLRSTMARPMRPQKREGKQLVRQHPYRRTPAVDKLSLTRAESRHSNGHTSVITPPGDITLHSPSADLHQLMAQVAAGVIAPDAAAYHVVQHAGEGLNNAQPATAAEQLHQQLSATQVTPQEAGASGRGDSETANIPGQADTEAEVSTSWDETGLPEHIIWAQGKSAHKLAVSLQRSAQKGLLAMAARVSPQMAEEVKNLLPEVLYSAAAQALTQSPTGLRNQQRLPGTVAIVSDGNGEGYVLEEARLAASALGCYAYKLGGASTAGLSSLLPNISAVQSADVVIVIGGASDDHGLLHAVAGSTESPVIAVPIDNSATPMPPGVTSVARNNGLAAAIFAARILRSAAKFRPASA